MQEADIDIDAYRQRLLAAHRKKPARWPNRETWKPDRKWRLQYIPWMSLLSVAALIFSLKALMIFRIGEDEYRAKLASYENPSFGERLGLMVMRPDIISLRIYAMTVP